MKVVGFFSLVLAALLMGPLPAHGQRAGHAPAVTGRRMYSINRTAPVRINRRTSLVSPGGTFASGFGLTTPYVGSGLTNLYPGTGLGINGINSILTQSNLGVEAAIDPATQLNLALAQRLLRTGGFGGGGYYLLTGGGAYAVPTEPVESDQPVAQQQQPQVIVVQQVPAQQGALGQEAEAPALPDVGQFTLVLQGGRQIQAIAFTHTNDRIIYITSDGSRRTLALSDLDTDATLRINEERGTPLQLPL